MSVIEPEEKLSATVTPEWAYRINTEKACIEKKEESIKLFGSQ
jgi:hypothetical protein